MEEKDVQQIVDDSIKTAMAFSTAKYGDTPSDALQLTPKKYVDGGIASVVSSLTGAINSIASGISTSGSNFPIFGDGSDGTITLDGATSYSFASIVVAASTYALIRDVRSSILAVSSGITLIPSGYRVFTNGTLTVLGGGIVSAKGNDAINTSGGLATTTGYLAGGVAGGDGAAGGVGGNASNGGPGETGNSSIYGNASSVLHSIGITGNQPSGNRGGEGGAAGGNVGGVGGSSTYSALATGPILDPRIPFNLISMVDMDTNFAFYRYQSSAGSSGGGGGGGGASPTGLALGGAGGRGGGGGGTGGIIAIFANKLIINPGGHITVKGGLGGNADTGHTGGNGGGQFGAGGGGGGGGGGGNGGVILLVCHSSSLGNTALTLDYSGGGGGNGGAGGINGNSVLSGINGQDGQTGKQGSLLQIAII